MKTKLKEILNSNGNIKQFLTDTPLEFNFLENVETTRDGWNIAERRLPNGKRLLLFVEKYYIMSTVKRKGMH